MISSLEIELPEKPDKDDGSQDECECAEENPESECPTDDEELAMDEHIPNEGYLAHLAHLR